MIRNSFLLLSLLYLSFCRNSDPTVSQQDERLSVSEIARDESDSTLTEYLLFEETFETTDFFKYIDDFDIGDWNYALEKVGDPNYNGDSSARFEIRENQPLVANGIRSEVSIVNGSKGDIDRENWYSFAVYCPSQGFEYDDNRDLISQWYQSGSPATSLRIKRDRFILISGNTKENREELDLAPLMKDQWHRFVIHIIHSSSEDGLIELWLDETKLIDRQGGNMYEGELPKWKIGIYKSGFKHHISEVDKRIIFFDDIRVGNAKATYEKMSPKNY